MNIPQTSKTKNGTPADSQTPAAAPYGWLKKIPRSLLQLDSLPPFSHHEEFPLAQFAQEFAKNLELNDLNLSCGPCLARSKESLTEGLGGGLVCLNVALPPFEGILYYLMPKEDILRLLSKILMKREETTAILDPYFEACIAFLSAEALNAFEALSIEEDLHPHLLETRDFPNEEMMTLDITLQLPTHQAVGRLLFSKTLQKALHTRGIQKQEQASFIPPGAEQVEVVLHCEIGALQLSPPEWESVKPGDVLILDRCGFKPNQSEGEITLSLKGHRLCKAKVESGQIKILEHPSYHEVI